MVWLVAELAPVTAVSRVGNKAIYYKGVINRSNLYNRIISSIGIILLEERKALFKGVNIYSVGLSAASV